MGTETKPITGLRAVPPIFWVILLVAAVLRVFAFDSYAAHHADEWIQFLEQAHRLVFDYGVVPWEFRYFIRSWLIPLLVAGPMQLGEWLEPGGTLYLILPRALIAAFNILPVIAAYYLGRLSSPRHAVVAMTVAAVWVEGVFFSVHTLSESLAIACFLPAAVLLRSDAPMRRVALAGMLMAVTGLLRFQFAPAVAVYALLVAGRDWRMWKGLLIGGIPVVIGGAAIDLAMGLTPYEWILNNYEQNIGQDRMRKIGGVSHIQYVYDLSRFWGYAAPFILLASLLAGKAYRPLLIAAGVNILVHQLIGHKEWRYLWFSMQILLVLAAIGSVNLAAMTLFGRRIERPERRAVVAALVIGWSALSLWLASSHLYRFEWRKNGEPGRLAAAAARDPRICGLAVNRYQNVEFPYAIVHRRIPIHLLRPDGTPSLSQPGAAGSGFNAMLVNVSLAAPAGYTRTGGCGGYGIERVCLWTRPGGCSPNADSRAIEHQAALNAADM